MKGYAYSVGKTSALKQLGMLKTAKGEQLASKVKNYLPKSNLGKGALLGAGIGSIYGLHRLMSSEDPKQQALPENYKIEQPNHLLASRY